MRALRGDELADLDDANERDYFNVTDELRAEIIKAGRIVTVHAYPNTPVGFICIGHHDLGAALDAALAEITGT